jgi:hypothetical protein
MKVEAKNLKDTIHWDTEVSLYVDEENIIHKKGYVIGSGEKRELEEILLFVQDAIEDIEEGEFEVAIDTLKRKVQKRLSSLLKVLK